MQFRSISAATRGFATACTALALYGCSAPPAAGPKAAFPAHDGRFAELFDDGIDASAVGLSLDQKANARTDSVLRERAHTAEAIARVRVKTVTSKLDGPEESYQVQLSPVTRLGGKKHPEGDFWINVDKKAPSFGIVKSFEARLVGKTFIAFVRRFASADAEAAYHVHLTSDAPDVEAAVKEAIVLDELH